MQYRAPVSTQIAVCVVALLLADTALARGPLAKAKPDRRGVAAGRPVDSSRYTFVEIPTPANAVFAAAVEVNESRLITGVYDVVTPAGEYEEYTFVWDGKAPLKTIKAKGAAITSVPGLNALGSRLYGNWGSDTQQTAGYYDLRSGEFTSFDPPYGKPLNLINRATDAGTMLGYSCDGTFFEPKDCVQWLSDGKHFDKLLLPEAPTKIPFYINNREDVVGFSLDAPPFLFSSWVYRRGVFTYAYPPLITPNECMFRSISNSGLILGNGETDPNRFWQPFLYDGRSTTLLPGYASGGQTTYNGLNEKGDLAGTFAFLADPDQGIVRFIPLVVFRK